LSNPFRSLTTMRYVPAGRRVTFLPAVVFRLMSNPGPVFAWSVVTAVAEAESARPTKQLVRTTRILSLAVIGFST